MAAAAEFRYATFPDILQRMKFLLDLVRRIRSAGADATPIRALANAPQHDARHHWFVDRWCYFAGRLHGAGWGFHAEGKPLRGVEAFVSGDSKPLPLIASDFARSSPDVVHHFGIAAHDCRFSFSVDVASAEVASTLSLHLHFEDGSLVIADPAARKLAFDPYHRLRDRFFAMLRETPKPTVVEIGSRARSGNVVRDVVGPEARYIGIDIMAGPNVDIVCDAHRLSEAIPVASADAIFSISVFEHLLMPWKVAIEINRVLKPGGLVLVMTHQSFPMHDTPWDYWRFSDQAWRGLFNRHTGFEVVETALGEPVFMAAELLTHVTRGFEGAPSFIGSAVICRKIGETSLSWPVDVADVVASEYPA